MMRKNHYQVVLAFALVLAVAASLWFSAPAGALTVDIDDPSTTRLGRDISFDVTVTIEDSELLPIQNVDLNIENEDDHAYKVVCQDLPITTAIKSYTGGEEGTDVDVSATADSTWEYRAGYGYAAWKGYAYYFGYGYGYGYQYGPTSIVYNVT